MSQTLAEMREKLGGIDAQFTSTAESLGQLRGAVGDLQSATIEDEPDGAQAREREELKTAWEAIRDQLERIAASPDIDGRTRARYNRIDRRRYGDLVSALARDGRLGQKADDFRRAVLLWQQHRNGRRAVDPRDCHRMVELRDALVADE